ncbi:MAG: HAD family hydrolase [Lentisphaerota bacterium]
MNQPGRKAVFIDRDGTLNEMVYDDTHGIMDSPRKPEQVVLRASAGDFIQGVKALGFLAVVVTNQPGLAKGTLTMDDLKAVNHRLDELLNMQGSSWDDLFFCPHHPSGGGVRNEYVRTCDCRKPKPGLLLQAAKKYDIDLEKSWLVGDGLNDVEAGRATGCRTILLTRLKIEQIERFLSVGGGAPHYIVPSLSEALGIIREQSRMEVQP